MWYSPEPVVRESFGTGWGGRVASRSRDLVVLGEAGPRVGSGGGGAEMVLRGVVVWEGVCSPGCCVVREFFGMV